MVRSIVQSKDFNKVLGKLIAQHKVLEKDFEEFKGALEENPEMGDLVPGTGGIRKTRLKSATKGKRGGFRVCYYDDPLRDNLLLILLYPKNEQENLSPDEIKELKKLTTILKKR